MDEITIWRAAKQLIAIYGKDAALQAAMRVKSGIKDNNADVVGLWTRVMRAIEQLERLYPLADETLN